MWLKFGIKRGLSKMKILALSKTFDFISCMEHKKRYIYKINKKNVSVFLVQSVGSIVV